MKRSIYILFSLVLLLIGCKENPVVSKHGSTLKTGEVIFFSSDRNGQATNIFMMSPEGKIIKQITKYDWGQYAATAVSPDGSQLLFYRANPGLEEMFTGADIYIYNFKEDKITGPITKGTPGNFSPGGNKFVFSRITSTSEYDYESVYLYDLTNNSKKKLTKDGKNCFHAHISQDGNFICYESVNSWDIDLMSSRQLQLMDINGNYIQDLTKAENGYFAGSPVFSHDSKSVIFYYCEDTWCFDICKVNINNKKIEYITQNRFSGRYDIPVNFKNPCACKNGSMVFFSSQCNDYQYQQPADIYSINMDGSGLKNITNNCYLNSHPVTGVVSYYISE